MTDTTNTATAFGAHLRSWRMILGLTSRQVPERACINRDSLSRLENGKSGIGRDVAFAVTRALGITDAMLNAVDPLTTTWDDWPSERHRGRRRWPTCVVRRHAVLMGRFELQDVLDHLPVAFRDAMLLDTAIITELARITDGRRAAGRHPGGNPGVTIGVMNRAAVVAAVAGIESYFEHLALAALQLGSMPPNSSKWFTIEGRYGALQTPSSANIRKLYWSLFHLDLEPSWALSVTTAAHDRDQGTTNKWRFPHNHEAVGANASNFLDAMLQVRHAFAHMDAKKIAVTGMALKRKSGTVTVSSHHAFNAVSAGLQLAIQSTLAIARELELTGKPRWKTGTETGRFPTSYWLEGSPLWENVTATWTGKFAREQQENRAATAELEHLEAKAEHAEAGHAEADQNGEH